ncbi:MAG: hypothetical protein A2015_10205 [Spirochaetes bacterium GWF1_31_7]|nr:MAG: hypothetical protein A2Y30_05840 [Spirochaetes bacterium GWE1_32_154]OHD49509.1 MAG: hypothetical protein A2Y29_01900 [Spirochaetes bacterium GWE2_31_10]OHD49702.1 MAG: hypothetical protein A2015_10205 [Spirochaetes bacterium GWF1_31_7]HBD96251.1 hypothetical protein [Spirochaetia bacterium]HBI38942.1 hypothetical protein [Spirochaetia bacterium]
MKYPIITLGSPHGIGYEIFLLSCLKTDDISKNKKVIIGSLHVFKFFQELLQIQLDYTVISFCDFKECNFNDKHILLIDVDENAFNITKLSDITPFIDGSIALKSIIHAADLIERGFFSSMVTLPVSKENINLIDSSFKGHTEYLMNFWHQENVFMSFISDSLNIMLLTTHVALHQVPKMINEANLKTCFKFAELLLQKLGESKPICLLGLNPHAGENGLMGNEEIVMKKVVKELNEKYKKNIVGPIPADTAFIPSNINKYGIYVASYHDQGLIPFKMLAFDTGVNLSFGMKYIRTSVDHGTAVDIIGKKLAKTMSFEKAYDLAIKLSM